MLCSYAVIWVACHNRASLQNVQTEKFDVFGLK